MIEEAKKKCKCKFFGKHITDPKIKKKCDTKCKYSYECHMEFRKTHLKGKVKDSGYV